MIHAAGVFEVKSWDEKPYLEIEGGSKFTRASVTKTYRGDVTGDATSDSLMYYLADGSAVFTGLERVVGVIGGRSGSFALQFSGIYRDGAATCEFTVVADSGAGELRGLRGGGKYVALHTDFPNVPVTFEYSLA